MVRVVPHDPAWSAAFDAEAARVSQAVGTVAVRLHHIGSTAIPWICAKPVIDLLLEVVSLARLDQRTATLGGLGYEALGEFGIVGRRYFRRDDGNGVRTHQMHAFQAGSHEAMRHLAFRDYMRAHAAIAHAYGALKQRLAAAHPHDMAAYIAGKDAFVREHERRSLIWVSGR